MKHLPSLACDALAELSFFREVGRYPVRIGCATLARTARIYSLAEA